MPSRRIALIGSIWLLSAAGAFSLGWLSSGGSGERRGQEAAKNGGVSPSAHGASASGSAEGKSGDVSMAAFFGTHGSGLEQILAGRTLEQHLKKLLSLDDAALRMQGFLQLLDGLKTPDDLKAALDLVTKENRRGGMRLTEQSLLLQKWAKMDASAAAGYASGLRDFSRAAGLDAVFKTWLQSDPEAAIAWAQKNGISANDAGPGGPGGPGGRDGGQDNWAMASLLETLAKTNIDRAMEVAGTQAYGRARGRMAETLIDELISQRGEQAAREAVLNISDEQLRAGFARELAQRLASTDPKGAAAWANGLPAGETRERAMAEAIQAWASKDPVAAGQYLQQLGASPEFDRARQDYAMRVVREDPEGALAWTQAITDERRRNDTTQQVLRSWMRSDATNAQAWAQANGVQIAAGPQGGPPGGFGFGGGGGRPRGGR